MTDNLTNQPVILPTQKVIKKKYIKPDFEVIDLEDTPKLLAASGPTVPGANINGNTNGGNW